MVDSTEDMPLVVRDARTEDIPVIRELTLEAYGEYASIMTPRAWEGLYSAIRRGASADEAVDRIIAELPSGIVGSVMLYPEGSDVYSGALGPLPWPEVRLLAVAPAARGRGIGAALMRECVRRAKAAGALRLGLHTSRSMIAAAELYRKMGFKRLSQYDFHPMGGEIVEAHVLDLNEEIAG